MSDRDPCHVRNPFPVYQHPPLNDVRPNAVVGWKWYDETWQESEQTYPTQRAALRALLDYLDWLENGPTLWQRVWWPIRFKFWPLFKRFWLDIGSGGEFSR